MPTPFAHSLWGLLFYPWSQRQRLSTPTIAACFIVVMSTLPDYDYLFALFRPDLSAVHRVFTDSVVFILGASVAAGMIAKLACRRCARFFVLGLTLGCLHLLLDLLAVDTNPLNGIGVPLFQPLSSRLFSFPLAQLFGLAGLNPEGVGSLLMDEGFFLALYVGVLGLLKLIRPRARRDRRVVCESG